LQWYALEFLVVCIGKYGDVARRPTFPENKGQEMFHGKVLHSLDYSKLNKEAARSLLKGKKVAVVGYKKSAIDLCMECADANHGIYIYIMLFTCIFMHIYLFKGKYYSHFLCFDSLYINKK
jgi:cation diffusion facilitator CzcD-associated flavoprotein CzcO